MPELGVDDRREPAGLIDELFVTENIFRTLLFQLGDLAFNEGRFVEENDGPFSHMIEESRPHRTASRGRLPVERRHESGAFQFADGPLGEEIEFPDRLDTIPPELESDRMGSDVGGYIDEPATDREVTVPLH